MSSFLLTNYTDSFIEIYKNQRIKMGIFLISLIGFLFFLSWYFWVLYLLNFCIDPILLCAIIPIKSYYNAEAEKVKILKDNQNKAGIYMFRNLINYWIGNRTNNCYSFWFDSR
jgi:cobalamin biosynthesis protein CobD/CbiB